MTLLYTMHISTSGRTMLVQFRRLNTSIFLVIKHWILKRQRNMEAISILRRSHFFNRLKRSTHTKRKTRLH